VKKLVLCISLLVVLGLVFFTQFTQFVQIAQRPVVVAEEYQEDMSYWGPIPEDPFLRAEHMAFVNDPEAIEDYFREMEEFEQSDFATDDSDYPRNTEGSVD